MKSLDALLPSLSARASQPTNFQEAYSELLGKYAPNLSPSVIPGLKAQWQGEYERWQSAIYPPRYVYVWADVVFLQARMDHNE